MFKNKTLPGRPFQKFRVPQGVFRGPQVPTGFPGPDPSLFSFTVEESIPIFAIINECSGRLGLHGPPDKIAAYLKFNFIEGK